MRYQVVFTLADRLQEALENQGAEALGEELDINPAHLGRLAAGNWTDVTRDHLQRLALWAERHGHDSNLFDSRKPHPLWESFANGSATIFLGKDQDGHSNKDDVAAQAELQAFFDTGGCRPRQEDVFHPAGDAQRSALVDTVRERIRNHNTVVICGPRGNAASEIVTASLWNAVPFDTSDSNRTLVPFELNYFDPAPLALDSAFASVTSVADRRGIVIEGQYDLRFPFRPHEAWTRGIEKATFDFALVVMCRKPLGTQKPVSTIVVMGLTGFATRSACESIRAERLHVDTMADSIPEFRLFCAKFRKGPGPDNRKLTDGCRWVRAPWDYWPNGAVHKPRGGAG